MTPKFLKWMPAALVAACVATLSGCHTFGRGQACNDGCIDGCDAGCDTCPTGRCKKCRRAVMPCVACRSGAIPDRYPLGSVMREHFHVMQTNGEAADFILHRKDFVGETAELTTDGKDRILEIAARMRSAPFPVIVERSEENANPELDAERRYMVASVLNTLGNADADQRTVVAPAYGVGLRDVEAEMDYSRYVYSRGWGGGMGFNNGMGNNGFGGGGFGGFGFGR